MAHIHTYASKGDNQNLEKELQQVDIDLPAETTGETALHRAALAGHTNTVKLLLERGANIYKLSKYRNNALHYAVQGILTAKNDLEKTGNYYQIFELLLSTEAKLRQQKALQLPEKWLKDTVNELKVTPITRLKNHPETHATLLKYVSKIEQDFIDDTAKLEPSEQNTAQLKRRIIKPLKDSLTDPHKQFSSTLMLTVFGMFNSLVNPNKKADVQTSEAKQPLLDHTEKDQNEPLNSGNNKNITIPRLKSE